MSRFRKGNSFPELGIPGDPRLLDAINRRTPTVSGGGEVTHVFGGTILTPDRRARQALKKLPFEITASATKLIAAAGTVHLTPIEKTILKDPANGDWYFITKISINNETGEILETSAEWVSEIPEESETEFLRVVGIVTIAAQKVEAAINFDFGPVNVFLFGTPTNRWAAALY